MSDTLSTLSPQTAWEPLPKAQWDESAARHLLQRIGFSATPAALVQAQHDGLGATLDRAFARMPDFPPPKGITDLRADLPALVESIRGTEGAEKRRARQRARERSREALADLTLAWLKHASRLENSIAEKWLLFLQDIWVVGSDKVKNTILIHQHQDILRRHALGSEVALAKAVSRSPAMIVYLDLQESKPKAPNENFARELFELFTLGEGHYTENDIKQAARAFTGYRQRQGAFIEARRQHDTGRKTVFGHTGSYNGDGIIDLAFRQPAAGTFLPREMARFYLTDAPLPGAHLAVLGAWWAGHDYDLRQLTLRFFGSRLFFAPEFRGNYIKSPVQFYLGLLQDLDLQVMPVPRYVIGALRQMGQMPFNPPNVRGWVGGRAWINSTTLAARRQVVNGLLRPINTEALNADERHALERAQQESSVRFSRDEAWFEQWASRPDAELTAQLLALAQPSPPSTELAGQIAAFVRNSGEYRATTVRAALAALLESPGYQLC